MIIDCAAYAEGKRLTPRLDLDQVADHLDRPDTFVWLGLADPSPEELHEVCDAFGADLDVPAVLALHHRPSLRTEDGIAWLVVRTATYDDQAEVVHLGELDLLASRRFVITVRHGDASELATTRCELESEPERLAGGTAAVVAAIVGAAVDSFAPALDGFEKDAIEVEQEVLSESRVRPLRRLLNLNRQVRSLQMAVDALDDPLERLSRSSVLPWTQEAQSELVISMAHLDRLSARTESLSRLVSDAHSANLSQVSMQQNDDMRKISAWAAIGAVPTAVAGVYGMNFEHMPELHNRWGYPIVLAIMATVCFLLYRQFRSRGWL